METEANVIPTVAEMLDWARGEPDLLFLYFDVKLAEVHDDAAAEFVLEMADAWSDGSLDHVTAILLSPHHDVVVAMEEARNQAEAPRFAVAWDHEGPDALRHTRARGLREISVGLTPQYTWSGFKSDVDDMVEARERGEIDAVTVWTFDRDMQIAELLYYSVDGIMTNDPGLVHRMWQDSLQ
jgi:glycerophosphoryl diester phosphodiesterase